MPGNPVPPYAPPPPVTWRAEWAPRDYWVPEVKRIPPDPTFQKWVPQSDTIAFGELPRDMSRFQERPQGFYPQPPVKPAPPKVLGGAFAQPRFDPPWTLRDYSANQDKFSVLATPLLPPPNPIWPTPRFDPPWTLRDYASNQDQFSWIAGLAAPTTFVPGPDAIVFGELPPDQTALQLSVAKPVRFDALVPRSVLIPPPRAIESFLLTGRERDMTAYEIVQTTFVAFAGIPVVPAFEGFVEFEYEPLDMTPYHLVIQPRYPPPTVVPYLYPTPPPYVEPPGWTFAQYPTYQDVFSALAPKPAVYPKGVVPRFPIEALIRDIPRPQNFPQTFIIPPRPPRVIPTPATFLPWKDWALRDYDARQSVMASILASFPVLPGFRVMAVTAGIYRGVYYYPGDVFDLVTALDYSDSRKNYQFNGSEWVPGWMQMVASSTPLYQSIPNQPTPTFPVLDPSRRWGAM